MEKFLQLVKESNRTFETADHLAYVTYPLVNDNKLILSIAENLFKALTTGMDAILYYDRLYKRIMHLPIDFNSKLEVFKESCLPRYSIGREIIPIFNELAEILDARNKSSMEFPRRNKFIICSNDYKLKSLTISKIKEQINVSKPFMNKLNTIYNQNVRRFRI
jgi:hypothetical protein